MRVPLNAISQYEGQTMNARMFSRIAVVFAAGLCATAQAQTPPTKDNLLGLAAQSSVKAPQDYLLMTLVATKEGTNGQTVQADLKKVLDKTLAMATPQEKSDLLKVRTGQFRVAPVYDNKTQRIQGWRGTAQIVLEGKDFIRITTLAANIENMPVVNVAFGLSPEARVKYEDEAQRLAVADFRARAGVLTKQFGFTNYTIDNVQVNSSQDTPMPAPMMARGGDMMSMSKASSPVPVEAGETTVTVNVNGSVQMR